MPNYTNKTRKKRIKKRDFKRKYNTSVGLLKTKKIDSLIESRMKKIAEDTVNQNRKTLVDRRHLWHKYDKVNNIFLEQGDDGLIDWHGKMCCLTDKIQKADMEMIANTPPADDPNTGEQEALDGDGIAQGQYTQTLNGRRIGETIYVTGISCRVRARVIARDLYDPDGELTETTDIGQIRLKYKCVIVKEGASRDLSVVPYTPAELLKWKYWGYDSRIDQDDVNAQFNVGGPNVRTVCSKEKTYKISTLRTIEDFDKIYVHFKKPVKIQYPPEDQNGDHSFPKIYFVARSTVPVTPDLTYIPMCPDLQVLTKLNYYSA